nr:TM0106 family RecB-like putative nuclease [Sphingomonas tagetis]
MTRLNDTKPVRWAITGSGLANLVTCERRFQNDLLGNPEARDPVNGFVEMLWREGSRHEDEVVGRIGHSLVDLREVPTEDRPDATLAAFAALAPVIIGGRLEIGDRVGMPDVLMLVDGKYHAGDIKSGSPYAPNGVDPRPAYAAQVGFYARMLEDGGWGNGERCFVIGGNGATVWFETRKPMRGGKTTIADEVARLTGLARDIREGLVQTVPAACAMCGLCIWNSACKSELVETDDVTLVAGIGRSLRTTLAGSATTVAELAALPIGPAAPAIVGIGESRLEKFVERARALGTPGTEAYAVRALNIAPRARELHLDLETDPTDGNLVYLHGVCERLRRGTETEERYVHFLAVDKSRERAAFADAMAFLSADPDALITTYSGFERSTYRMLQRRYPDVATVEEVDALFTPPRGLDLYFGAVLPSTVWPLHSLGLKPIARHLGFQWQDDDASGAASISWFVEYVRSRDPAMLKRILAYNRDDCTASMVVFDGLLKLPVRAPLPWPPSS